MTIWRKLAIVFAILFLAVGLWLLIFDLWFIHHYGFDYNDVADIVDEGPVDWPTGERPLLFIPPLYFYALPLLLGGVLMLFIRTKPPYRGRIHFGAE